MTSSIFSQRYSVFVVTSIARQRLSKHVPAANNAQAKIEVLLSYNDGNGVFFWVHHEAIYRGTQAS
jgi:hypothetical protein